MAGAFVKLRRSIGKETKTVLDSAPWRQRPIHEGPIIGLPMKRGGNRIRFCNRKSSINLNRYN
jgi:hypothetical protein